jgi:uncharacterized protein with FMN-binding domain
MRRVSLWLLATVAVVVLLFSYRTSTGGSAQTTTVTAAQSPYSGTTSSGTSSSSGSSGSGTTQPSPAASSSSSSSANTATVSKTYTGSTASTRWGDVQVKVTVSGGKITQVNVPVYPSGNNRDEEINSYALPQLIQETLAAQNAQIDTVSGATVTSDGYLESLQSALDAAHLS